MTDDSAAAGDPAVVMARHKRRRKKTNRRIASSSDAALNDDKMEDIGWRHNAANSPSTNCCSALDEELENQVNRLIVQSRNEANNNKKKRHACEMADDMSSCGEVTNNNVNRNDRQDDMSTSLPVLLHIREIGLSSRLGRCHTHIPFIRNVDSLDANGRYASWMNLLLHQPTYSPTRNLNISKHNNNINHTADERKENNDEIASDDQGQHANNAIRRLRVPIQNRHALNNNDEDGQYYYHASTSTTEECSVYKHKSWRPYTQQTIQFSKLKTPHSAAILAMNQWGGYSIGVVAGNSNSSDRGRTGDNNDNMMSSVRRPSLTLNFYGIPSPARLLSIATDQSTNTSRTTITSPLFHSIPLLFTNSNSINDNNAELEDAPMHNICDTPIQILLCSNGAFGIGYILDSQTIAPHRNDIFSKNPSLQEDFMGTVVIFETPSSCGTVCLTKSFHCCNLRIGSWKSFTMRNNVWPTKYVPVKKFETNRTDDDQLRSSFLLVDTSVSSAYMLFNDEDDGFRITWITPFHSNEDGKSISLPCHKIKAARNDIITATTDDNTWEECLSDPCTGLVHQNEKDGGTTDDTSNENIRIAYEVYLHVDALLIDILARRQKSSSMFKMSPYQSDTVVFIPNFYYNLISVSEDGLNATLVIVFSNKEKMMMQSSSSNSNNNKKKKLPASLGVVISFGIFTQSYDELKWFQNPSCYDDVSMKRWCNSLALNWRMKECGVGVFCLESQSPFLDNWVGTTHERNTDEDLEDDYNQDVWRKYCSEKPDATTTPPPPKDISMSSLYPHCDVITNRAVYDAIPVKRISCRKSSIDLVYG